MIDKPPLEMLEARCVMSHSYSPESSLGPSSSFVKVAVLSGPAVTLWSDGNAETSVECQLELSPDRPIIVGRQEGHRIEYLDPAYRPTQAIPGTGKTVLKTDGQGDDLYVSRGHFMLRAIAGGILFVNGVPRRGGGIRPPLNGTALVAPNNRQFAPGEEYLIEHGNAIVIGLPNHSEIRIHAD